MKLLHLILPLDPAHRRPPGLAIWLARGRALAPAAGMTALLGAAFGLTHDGDWPIAAASAAMDGLDAGNPHWLRADPVHLEAAMNGLILRAVDDLSADEAAAFAQVLAPACAEFGARFAAPGPRRWYLGLPEAPRLATTPPDEALGRPAMGFLPAGAGARRLMRLINAVQMRLHDHPLNRAREAAGRYSVNSLWPWGGGNAVMPAPAYDAVWGDDPTLLALARAAGIPARPCPDGLAELGKVGRALVLLPAPAADPEHPLATLDGAWFSPALRALSIGRIREARLALCGDQVARIQLSPALAWRLWRRG